MVGAAGQKQDADHKPDSDGYQQHVADLAGCGHDIPPLNPAVAERVSAITVLVRAVVTIPIAVIVGRAFFADAKKRIVEQNAGEVVDKVESHIHSAPANHQPVTPSAPHIEQQGDIPVDVTHSVRHQGDFPLHSGPGHMPEDAVNRIPGFKDLKQFPLRCLSLDLFCGLAFHFLPLHLVYLHLLKNNIRTQHAKYEHQ